MTTVFRVSIPLVFPEGISPGESRSGNLLSIARDGVDRPILRGTALAGALRHAWIAAERMRTEKDADRWFGYALEDNMGGTESLLKVSDCVLEGGGPSVRTHNAIDRHTGAPVKGGLFSLETLPPGTKTCAVIWLNVPEGIPTDEARAFVTTLCRIASDGLSVGGNASRGIGRVLIDGYAVMQEYDCKDLDQHAFMLDEHYRWRSGEKLTLGDAVAIQDDRASEDLVLEVAFTLPTGSDLLVGDGQGVDYEVEPQRVICADGKERWRIQGSSLRGVLRGWMSRLAARDKRFKDKLNNSHKSAVDLGRPVTGEDLAWGIGMDRKRVQGALSSEPENLDEEVPCPIMSLFGSSYAKGRLHITDALSATEVKKADEQVRAHVAVDRITGGASEGFLFMNTVLVGSPVFNCRIRIRDIKEHEAQWLYASLRAIDLGILRVGSSKAGGRLILAAKPTVKGIHSDTFNSLGLSEV